MVRALSEAVVSSRSRVGAYICLFIAILAEILRPSSESFGFACAQDVFWSIAFSLALATAAYVDGSFEANSPRIRSHLAQAIAFH